MTASLKLLSLIISVLFLGTCSGVGGQRVSFEDKTIKTPVGRLGIWKITTGEPGYASREYRVFFGKAGSWRIKGADLGRQAPVLTIFVLACMAGAVAVEAQRRTKPDRPEKPGPVDPAG